MIIITGVVVTLCDMFLMKTKCRGVPLEWDTALVTTLSNLSRC